MSTGAVSSAVPTPAGMESAEAAEVARAAAMAVETREGEETVAVD